MKLHGLAAFGLAAFGLLVPGVGARAAPPAPTTHVVFVSTRGALDDAPALRRFSAATLRYGLGPVEVVEPPGLPAPMAPGRVAAARLHLEKSRFDEALAELSAAAREAEGEGARGFDPEGLSELYLLRAWAAHRAGAKVAGDPQIAWPDYLRACAIAPHRTLAPKRFPPAVLEQWKKAQAEVKRRGTGTIVVKAKTAGAAASIDGGPLLPMPATVPGLAWGEHVVRVEEPGFAPWGTVVPLSAATLDVDAPSRPALAIDDAQLAAQGQRVGAAFVLAAQLRLPAPKALIDVRLIDVRTGQTRDAAVTGIAPEDGTLENTVMRLDEEARRVVVARERGAEALPPARSGEPASPLPSNLAPPPPDAPRPHLAFTDDPLAWSRDHWPLAAAAGVMVSVALVLSYVVATDKGR